MDKNNNSTQGQDAFIITTTELEQLNHFFMNVNMPRTQTDAFVEIIGRVAMRKVEAEKLEQPDNRHYRDNK